MSQILREHTVVLFLQIICTFCGVLGAGHLPERVVCICSDVFLLINYCLSMVSRIHHHHDYC